VQADRISDRAKLDALTSIRFFLSAMVVVFHFTAGRFSSEIGALPNFVYGMGPLAVSWFFMLSGFIIAHNYPAFSTNQERINFLALRIARLSARKPAIEHLTSARIQIARDGGWSHQVDRNLDIVSRGFGVRTVLVRFVHQVSRDIRFKAR
jgi:peptidoglycan/LPS O-acetylase OafA/YrhL